MIDKVSPSSLKKRVCSVPTHVGCRESSQFVLMFKTRGETLAFAISFALMRAKKVVRGLSQELTEAERQVVAERAVERLVPMRWGLVPRWWNKTLKDVRMATFNARAETVETKPFFRDAFKRNRCLIPMSGYYEWQDTPDGKQPWYFTARDDSSALTAAARRHQTAVRRYATVVVRRGKTLSERT
jgi:putative SOS response-associated peptidase YedK